MTEGAGVTFRTASEAETERLAASLAERLVAGDVVALTGELGAGKTRFARGLVRGLGGDPARVSSPTFVLSHEHPLPAPIRGIEVVVHIDAYRLTPAQGLASAGIESASDAEAVTVIEWADRIADDLPPGAVRIDLRHTDRPGERLVTVSPMAPTLGVMADETAERRVGEAQTEPAPACPICGEPSRRASTPFCSDRCRMVDLGRWLRGEYVISRDADPTDADENA